MMYKEVLIFTLPICPNCEKFKQILNDYNIPYNCKDLNDINVYNMVYKEYIEKKEIDALINGSTYVAEAPIVWVNGIYMEVSDALNMLGIKC